MKVWRAIGGKQSNYNADCFAKKTRSDSIFVAPDEITAIGWAVVLGKTNVTTLNVKCIRDKKMRVIEKFPVAYSGIEDIPLREAVILPEDILEEVS